MRSSIYYVLVPLVVGLLGLSPWVAGFLYPDRQLQFTLTGLVDVQPLTALRLNVENRGKYPEKNVQIILDSRMYVPPDERALADQIRVATKIPFTVKRDGDRLIVLIGDLRPKESVGVGIASAYISVSAFDVIRAPLGISIKSDESLADYESGASFLEKHSLGISGFLSICLMIFGILGMARLLFVQLQKAVSKPLEETPKTGESPDRDTSKAPTPPDLH